LKATYVQTGNVRSHYVHAQIWIHVSACLEFNKCYAEILALHQIH